VVFFEYKFTHLTVFPSLKWRRRHFMHCAVKVAWVLAVRGQDAIS
jgi:hypothetical protein